MKPILMNQVNWGIIGCGDVTEIKSGPAFNKLNNSRLVAVMRRDEEKLKDYALRHHVPKWYTDAKDLINDPEINAIYVATPPSSHEEYTLASINAGKPIYVEKPMALNPSGAKTMVEAANAKGIKMSIAHYRRGQPFFNRIKELIKEGVIGNIRFAKLDLYKKALSKEELAIPKTAWRVDPLIAGGGLFHDLAPHQLDLAVFFFGEIDKASGMSTNQAGLYPAEDMVAGNILFKTGIMFNGTWNFALGDTMERDSFEITGTKGTIQFSVFGDPVIHLNTAGQSEVIRFDPLQHVQQPMIEKVVAYFLNRGDNPCSGADGLLVMELMEKFTNR